MNNFLSLINVTWGGVIILLLTLFVIEATGVIGRQHEKNITRTPFSWASYFGDWVNWLSIVVNLATSLILIGIREGIVEFGGLKVDNEVHFELFFAAVVGVVGQTLWKKFLSIAAAFATGIKAPPPGR